jgi:hypothetical protein
MSPDDATATTADERATVLGVEPELAVAAGCGALAVASLAALPLAGDFRAGTMLLAVALFGVFAALGAFGLYSAQ